MPPRKTIEDMRMLAASRGFECISNEYCNARVPLQWRCSKGHVWETNSVNIYNGNGCPECSNRKRLTIEDMRILAELRGGKCLSSNFITNKIALKWQCSEGHMWEARPDRVKNQGSWCPICALVTIGDAHRLTLKSAQELMKM